MRQKTVHVAVLSSASISERVYSSMDKISGKIKLYVQPCKMHFGCLYMAN